MVAEWSKAPAISSREQGEVGSSPCPAKIPFSDEKILNNSRVEVRVQFISKSNYTAIYYM